MELLLSNLYADAGERLAGEVSFLRFDESHDTIFRGVNREVPGHISTWAGDLGATGLTNNDLAIFNFLATKTLDAEALASVIMDILGGTASFNM